MLFVVGSKVMFYSFLVYGDFAPLIIRLVLGFAFMVHGYPKLFRAESRQQFSGWLASMGFKPGGFWGTLVGVVEFLGGAALAFGFYVQIAAFLIAIDMLVAMASVKWGKFGFTGDGGWELDLAYCIMALSLVLTGAGAGSLEYFFLI